MICVNFDCNNEINALEVFKGFQDVVDIMDFNPFFDPVVGGREHEEVLAHSLRLKTAKESIYLGYVYILVSANFLPDCLPFSL